MSEDDRERIWLRLRTGHLREQVTARGAEEDYIALVRAVLAAHAAGDPNALDEAYELLCEAEQRHKRSVPVLEYLAMITAQTRRDAEFDRVVRALESVDPTSRVLRIFDETTQDSGREWAQNVDATQAQLLDAAGSDDEQQAEAAVRELARWARSFPANSTYAVNHGFGLIMRGRYDEARQVARDARRIEDGSFADAYNLGQILCSADAQREGLELLLEAARRAGSDEESEIAAEALAQAGGR
jgi:hypothetical protein